MATSNETSENLKLKLERALKRKSVLQQKSKLLEQELERARSREDTSMEVMRQLLERQRELNIMLNRTNLMLNRVYEVNSLLSFEFNDLVKALPAPKSAEWEDRVSRIQDLFKKTGIEEPAEQDEESEAVGEIDGIDAEFSTLEHADRREALWHSTAAVPEPPSPAAEPAPAPEQPSVIEIPPDEESSEPAILGRRGYPLQPEEDDGSRSGEEHPNDNLFPARLRRWIQRIKTD